MQIENNTTKHTGQFINFIYQEYIPRNIIEDSSIEIQALVDEVSGTMLLKFQKEILTYEGKSETTTDTKTTTDHKVDRLLKVPKTWWDFLKLTWNDYMYTCFRWIKYLPIRGKIRNCFIFETINMDEFWIHNFNYITNNTTNITKNYRLCPHISNERKETHLQWIVKDN